MVARGSKGTKGASVAATALLIAGCGGGGDGAVTQPTDGAGGTSPAGGGTTVAVTETEFSIELAETTFTPGTYTFEVKNEGNFPHNLVVKGPGVDSEASPTLQGGESGQLTVTLSEGTYEVWCSVDAHRARGMDLTIDVG